VLDLRRQPRLQCREHQMNREPTRDEISSTDATGVDCHSTRGYRQPQSIAPDRTIACRVYTVEGLENELEILLRYSGAVIADDHFDPAV